MLLHLGGQAGKTPWAAVSCHSDQKSASALRLVLIFLICTVFQFAFCEQSRRLLWVRSQARPVDDEASVTKCSGQNCTSCERMQFWAPQTAAQPRMPFYLHVVNTRTKKREEALQSRVSSLFVCVQYFNLQIASKTATSNGGAAEDASVR